MREDIQTKVIAGTGAGLLIASLGLGGWSVHQSHKIDNLKDNVQQIIIENRLALARRFLQYPYIFCNIFILTHHT